MSVERLRKRGYKAMLTYNAEIASHLNEPPYMRTARFTLSLLKGMVVPLPASVYWWGWLLDCAFVLLSL